MPRQIRHVQFLQFAVDQLAVGFGLDDLRFEFTALCRVRQSHLFVVFLDLLLMSLVLKLQRTMWSETRGW